MALQMLPRTPLREARKRKVRVLVVSAQTHCSKTVAAGCTRNPRDSTAFNDLAANVATRGLATPSRSASFNNHLDRSSKPGGAASPRTVPSPAGARHTPSPDSSRASPIRPSRLRVTVSRAVFWQRRKTLIPRSPNTARRLISNLRSLLPVIILPTRRVSVLQSSRGRDSGGLTRLRSSP